MLIRKHIFIIFLSLFVIRYGVHAQPSKFWRGTCSEKVWEPCSRGE